MTQQSELQSCEIATSDVSGCSRDGESPGQRSESVSPICLHAQQSIRISEIFNEGESLCQRCSSIDIEALWRNKRVSSFPAPVVLLDLGLISTHMKQSFCPLCHFFALLLSTTTRAEGKRCELVVCVVHCMNPIVDPTFCLAIASRRDRSQTFIPTRDYAFFSVSDLVLSQGHKQSHAIHVRPNKLVDFKVIKSWFHHCEQYHEGQCVFKTEEDLQLQVIDCATRTIVDLPQDERYLALSYVWGSSTSQGQLEKVGTQLGLPPGIPRTIEDAIKVTSELSFKYLWVDRYCISAESPLRHEQIMSMDLVYQHAYATIIAAAGAESSYGLPGVSSTARNLQPTINIGGRTWAAVVQDPRDLITSSLWATRAWTYQEGLFSRKRLFFTSSQVYFECRGYHQLETLDEAAGPRYVKTPYAIHDWDSKGLFPSGGLGSIYDRIVEYSKRSLTYDHDILNGMQGLLHAFSKSTSPVYHHWGLPFHPGSVDHKSQTDFLSSLYWTHTSYAERRLGFPSWSWTGWRGPLSIFKSINRTTDSFTIWVEDEKQQLLPWQSFSDRLIQRPWSTLYSPFLVIEAPVFEVCAQYDWYGDSRLGICGGGMIKIQLDADPEKSGIPDAQTLIVLPLGYKRTYFGLVLIECDGHYERIGRYSYLEVNLRHRDQAQLKKFRLG